MIPSAKVLVINTIAMCTGFTSHVVGTWKWHPCSNTIC